MKKIISIILILVTVLALCACTVNKTEVSILWAGDNDHALVPNSLINAVDRAMYIEKIDYNHYAAAGDQATQTQQAADCLNAGCSALMVELVDASAAQTIVDLAKAKDVPVIFFGTEVDRAVVNSYAKCAAVSTNEEILPDTFDRLVCEYVLGNLDAIDLDADGKIHYITVGDITLTSSAVKKDETTLELIAVDAALEDLQLQVETKEVKKLLVFKTTEESRKLTTLDGAVVEMILVADDQQAMDTLLALQALDMNTDKLATCFVPVFTVGADADYKAYVMEGLPADAAARSEYLAEMALLADMTGLEQKEWDKRAAGQENEVDSMIFNTMNQIDTGRLSGTVVEDYDAVAEAAARLAVQLLKGEAIESQFNTVSYTTYG